MVPAKVANLTEGVLKAMMLKKLKTATALLVAVFLGAAGAIYQTQAAEQPKHEQKNKTVTDVLPSPPLKADLYRYILVSLEMKAGAEQAEQLIKMSADEGQLCRGGFPDNPRNLLEKVVLDEKIKIVVE